MTNSTTAHNGGLIRFVPFQDSNWTSQFLLESLQHVELQVIIATLIITILLLILFISRLCYSWHKQRSQCNKAVIQPQDCRSETSSEAHYFKTNDYEWVDDLWHPDLRASKKAKWKKSDSNFNISSEIYVPNQNRLLAASEIKPLFKLYTRRIIVLSIVSALFVICLVGHVASLIIAVRSQQNLVNSLNGLPVQINLISQNGIGFVHFAMDIALNISKAHILNDAHRVDNGSYLQGFVSDVKELVSQVIACLAYDCYNLTDKRTSNLSLLPPQNTSQSDLDKHHLIAQQLLRSFELAIKRFENLNNAAQKLSPKAIQAIQHAWYEYRRDLSTLVPDNPILTSADEQQNWASYTLVKQTRDLICTHLNQSHLNQFESCNQVEAYLNRMIQYANQLPYMMPSNRLDKVTAFTLIPRALNVEPLVNQWMPVLYDLPGKGLVLLLDTFLKPEMNKAELHLRRLSNTLPPTEITDQLALYTRYLNSALIILFVVFVTLAAIVCLVFLILHLRHWKKLQKCRKFLTKWNRFDHNVSDFHQLIQKPTGCKSIFSLLGLIFLGLFILILIIISLGMVYASVLANLEGCNVLMGNQQNLNEIDQILTNRLKFTASTIPQLVPFLAIDRLNLQYPKHILTTLNNPYQNGRKPLLGEIEMTKPVNFTALLEAPWTLDQIQKAWDKDVTQKLNQEDLKSKIPQINLTQIYDQTAKTLNLAKSFDDLEVGHVTDYLIDAGPNWFVKLSQSLQQIPTKEAQKLADFYNQLDTRYSDYSNLYDTVDMTLKQIHSNKALLEVISVLVDTGSLILEALKGKSNADLIELINQFLPVVFPKLKPIGEKYLIPFVESLLVDMIPYNGLDEIYLQTLQLACPKQQETGSTSNEHALVKELQTMAISMSSLGITLLLLILICSILF